MKREEAIYLAVIKGKNLGYFGVFGFCHFEVLTSMIFVRIKV